MTWVVSTVPGGEHEDAKGLRLADGVLDLGLVKLVNLGMNPIKSVEPLINAWEYIV